MKLYIPTCSINIANILSTESISPEIVYKNRTFGNRHFQSLNLFENKNTIVLFSKYPRYELPKDGIENYYMVISIDTNDYPEDYFVQLPSVAGIGIYSCTKTIYLNPFNCFFYLPSAEAVIGTRFNGMQTIESKFAQLYDNNYIIRSGKATSKEDSFELKKIAGSVKSDDEPYTIPIIDIPECKCNSDADYLTDKIRGFIYSYIIGANGYYSKELAELCFLGRMLRNKFSAIIHSPEGKPLPSQIPAIKQMIENFNELCDKIDDNKRTNDELVRNRIKFVLETHDAYQDEKSIEKAQTSLEMFGYYQDFYEKTPGILDTFDANELWKCIESVDPGETYKNLISKMEGNLHRIHKKELETIAKVSLNDCFSVAQDDSISIIDPRFPNAKSFYSRMVNMLCSDEYKAVMEDAGVSETEAIIYKGGVILKEIIGETADEQAQKGVDYLRQLFSSLSDGTKFDVASHNSPILQSFAAFGQQHDDISNLDSYLEFCKISDRRLAYGLLGARYGFASLPKTFTTSLIDSDREYYKAAYSAFYEMIFNHKLSSSEYPFRKERVENNVDEQNKAEEITLPKKKRTEKKKKTSDNALLEKDPTPGKEKKEKIKGIDKGRKSSKKIPMNTPEHTV